MCQHRAILCITVTIITLCSHSKVNCNEATGTIKQILKYWNGPGTDISESSETESEYESSDRDIIIPLHPLNKLQKRRVLLDSLIEDMTNHTHNDSIDWASFGIRRANVFQDKYEALFDKEDTSPKSIHSLVAKVKGKREKDENPTSPIPPRRRPPQTLQPFNIKQQMMLLVSQYDEHNLTTISIGRTAEFNDLVLIQAQEGNGSKAKFRASMYEEGPIKDKKIILIVHGLSVMGFKEVPCLVVMRKFKKLLAAYFDHLDKFDIFVMPMANPDGVAYSYHFPIWNKNMSPQDACPGVAVDRNFDVAWGNTTTKTKSCSQQYPGPEPFSEMESQAVKDVLHYFGHKIVGYIHVHAAGYHEHIFKGDAVLYPKGYSDYSGDDDRYIDLKSEVEETLGNASFKVMSVTVDTLYNWYGPVFGSSVDYASTVYGIPFALEFVMQLYDADPKTLDSDETAPGAAQTEIWHRLIDCIFTVIYKSTTTVTEKSEEQTKKPKL